MQFILFLDNDNSEKSTICENSCDNNGRADNVTIDKEEQETESTEDNIYRLNSTFFKCLL